MKKLIYAVFTLAFALLFLNNSTGPVVRQQKGYTGAPGDQPGTCATTGCHTGGTFNPTLKIELFDSLGTTAVARYVLNRQYTVRLTISSAATPAPTGWGFQLIDIRRSDNSNVKGFLAKDKQDANIGIDTIAATATTASRVYAEHNARLTSNIINIKWKAPATDLGIVTFYGAGNATNAGGSSAGDNGTPSANLQVASPTVSRVNELAENISIQLSPNPTPSEMVINLDSKAAKNLGVTILDLSGRSVITEKWQIQVGENKRSVNLGSLSQGVYMLQITDNQDIVTKKVIKI
jgi:Secretion system C-terminal sorting domain